jgi:hypothetical protein
MLKQQPQTLLEEAQSPPPLILRPGAPGREPIAPKLCTHR